MIKAARVREINALLDKAGVVSIADLARRFGASPVTIRRDLLGLERDGYLLRTHGGATVVAPNGQYEPPPYAIRESEHAAEKNAIAAKAAEYVRDGDTLLLNAGTSANALAAELTRRRDLQVVTNGLTVAVALAAAPGAQVFMIGGAIDFKKLGAVGPQAEEAMQDIRVEKAFLGMAGVSIEHGLFMHSAAEARINRRFVASAREVTLLVDSSKFNMPSPFRVASLREIHRIVTDARIRPEIREALQRMDLELVVADSLPGARIPG
ncbi:MAG: DeoR/GlpR family DNA-binding transcription regulator [Burkholderiaceae bacterium]|nr:DeoR/GlpR family DNA-binding transcription regulator [Burkholderiaceae bacterium]